jgi:hypothetical protein
MKFIPKTQALVSSIINYFIANSILLRLAKISKNSFQSKDICITDSDQ